MADLRCTKPDAITTGDLIAFLDDAATSAVTAHVKSCAYCRARAKDDALTQGKLRNLLHRFECPPAQRLGDYYLDFLSPDDRREIAEHLIDCPRCKAEIATLRSFLADDASVSPRSSRNPLTIVARLLAPPPNLAAAGLRGGNDSATQVFVAGNTSITVAPGPASRPSVVSLVGLIDVGVDDIAPSGGDVHLAHAMGETISTTIDDQGSFFFEDIRPGIYNLTTHLHDAVIVVRDLRVGVSE